MYEGVNGEMSSGAAQLRLARPSDSDFLFEIAQSRGGWLRVNGGHRALNPHVFLEAVWRGVAALFIVSSTERPQEPVGLASVYELDQRNETAFVEMIVPNVQGAGVELDAARKVVDFAFENWNLRKLYCEHINSGPAAFNVLGDLVVVEGMLCDDHYDAGRYWDRVISAIYRDEWAGASTRGPSLDVQALLESNPTIGAPDVADPRPSLPTTGLSGRRVRLRPLQPSDYPYLFELETSESIFARWRFHGITIPPETYARDLWNGVATQFLVVDGRSEEPIGLVSAYNANSRNGTAFIAILLDPSVQLRGWAQEAAVLFVDYLFRVLSFRKLYAEVLDFNLARSAASGVGRLFRVEARLREHAILDQKLWDMQYTSLYRTEWSRRGALLADRLRNGMPGIGFNALMSEDPSQ